MTRWRVGWAVAAGVSLAMLAPTLRPGFVLRLDMVFVPNPALSAHSLGLDGSIPRAVPMDFVVALLSRGLPADVVEKVLLLAAPVLGVLGVWRLLRGAGVVGQLAGALAFSWNAYIYERLVLGHWSLLLGVAVLPWVLAAALDLRVPKPRALRHVLLWLGVACVASPTTGLLALAVAGGVLIPPSKGRSWADQLRSVAATVGAGVLFTAPWWLPGLLATTRGPADPGGVAAFAPRSDTPLGPLGSLLTFGGIWNAAVVPPGRDTWPVALAGLAVLVVAGVGLSSVVRHWGRPAFAGFTLVALAGLLCAAAVTTSAGVAILRHLVAGVAGFGLLRDGQKLVAVWLLLVSVCFGFGVARLRSTGALASAARPVAVLIALVPVALLPGLAWGASGRLAPVAYPADYAAVQRLLADSKAPGGVLVLPWHLYRSWSWNNHTTTLDPMERLLGRTTLVRDDLELGDRVVAGEDPRVPAVTAALVHDEPLLPILARLGIRFVVVDLDTVGGPVEPKALAGLARIFDGRALAVYSAPAPASSGAARGVPMIIGADLVAALVWLTVAVSMASPRGRALLEFVRRRDGTPP